MFRHHILQACNFSKQVLFCTCFKRMLASDHSIQNDSKSPSVSWRSLMLLFQDNFWCHIAWSSSPDFYHFSRRKERAESKVNQFCGIIFINQYIFTFYIPMGYGISMSVCHSLRNLMKDSFCYCFAQSVTVDSFQHGSQRLPRQILQDQMQVLRLANGSVHLENAWMIKLLEDFDFSGYCLFSDWIQ